MKYSNFFKNKKTNSGQALLVVLLSLSVVLIIVLYIVSRSITDISTSTKDEESLRAFSAAEAGIERALVTGSSASNQSIGSATYSSVVTAYSRGEKFSNYPLGLRSGNSATFWFVGHNSDGSLGCTSESCFTGNSLKLCWGNAQSSSSSSDTPAIEVAVFYESTAGSPSTLKIARAAFDPNTGRSGASGNGFTSTSQGSCQIDGKDYAFSQTFSLSDLGITSYLTPNSLKLMKVKMLYNTNTSHDLGLSVDFAGNSTLPSQGNKIDSTGSFSDANRRIEVYELHPVAPSVFDNVIFSGSGITKN